MIPLTLAMMGTSLGVAGAIPPLVAGAAPFYARLVETALRDIPRSTIEAAQAMGATRLQIIGKVLLPEALPGLISGATVTAIALVSFTAMAGVVGAGGLGDLAIRYGYQRFQADVMLVTVALLVLLVQLIQWSGDWLARRTGTTNGDTLTVAATAVPHAEILDHVRPALEKQGVKLDVRVFNDYVQPNQQVAQGQIQVNYFQTGPYLDEFNHTQHSDLQRIAGIHIEPLGAYSRKWKSLDQLPTGGTVAIPNDASNGGRALLLLQKTGLIQLKDPANPLSSVRDITANPKKIVLRELEAATLPRTLGEVDLALINTNYALDAKLNPMRDALAIEDGQSPYVNFVVGKPGSDKDPRVQKLVAALQSDDVKAFIADRYKGAVLPAF
ncbi:hypothetical protein LTR94_025462 [Friedmanniomyces endolithicus]|nr:hypothetical protein LTR94_025462 [Friedmanniomyces endolithicus]